MAVVKSMQALTSNKPTPAAALGGWLLVVLGATFTTTALQAEIKITDTDTKKSKIAVPEMLDIKTIQTRTLAHMRANATNSAGTRVEYQAAPMDSRLSMRSCTEALQFEPQTDNARSGRTLVKVRCNDAKPWAMYVPLKVERWQTVVTASKSIQRNAVITQADIALREQKLLGPTTDYAQNSDTVVGLQSRRAIAAGNAINTRQLVQPKLIRRGDDVVIVANSMGVSAKMPGTAMADGRKNQQIQVRNQSSKRMIKARVIAPGTVEVIM